MTDIVEENFNITRESGEVLEGFLTYSTKAGREGPVAVWIHGTLSDAKHNFTPDLSTKLAKDCGIRSFRYTGRYHSTEKEPNHRYKFSGYADDIDDMECCMKALKLSGFVPWCLIGHSRGANDALIYASKHNSAAAKSESVDQLGVQIDADQLAVVSVAARFHMPGMLGALFSEEQIKELESKGETTWHTQMGDVPVMQDDVDVVQNQLNMKDVLDLIPAQVPILILHGTEDELIDVGDAHAYKEARPSIDLTIVEGARHAFRGKKQKKQLLRTVTEWLKEKAPGVRSVPAKKPTKMPTKMPAAAPKLPVLAVPSPRNVMNIVVDESPRNSPITPTSLIMEVSPRGTFCRPYPPIITKN